MDKVCMILNFQGFRVSSSTFFVRELGYASTKSSPSPSDWSCGFVTFDLSDAACLPDAPLHRQWTRNDRREEESEELLLRGHRDYKTFKFCRRYVHGLPVFPTGGFGRRGSRYVCNNREQALHHTLLDEQVWSLYERHRSEDRPLVAFKGGYNEKEVLDRLGIPSLDLEKFGCPNVARLQQMFGIETATCGNHDGEFGRTWTRVPCAMAKAKLLRKWMFDERKLMEEVGKEECFEDIKRLEREKQYIEVELNRLRNLFLP